MLAKWFGNQTIQACTRQTELSDLTRMAESVTPLRRRRSRFDLPLHLECPQNQEGMYPWGYYPSSDNTEDEDSDTSRLSPENSTSPKVIPDTLELLSKPPDATAWNLVSRNLLDSFCLRSMQKSDTQYRGKNSKASTQEPVITKGFYS